MSSEYLSNLDKGTTSLGSKNLDKVVNNNKLDADNLYNRVTSLRSKGSDRLVSDESSLESSRSIKAILRS